VILQKALDDYTLPSYFTVKTFIQEGDFVKLVEPGVFGF